MNLKALASTLAILTLWHNLPTCIAADITTYDANEEYVAHQLGPSASNPFFGPFIVGVSGANGAFTPFSSRIDNWYHPAMKGFAELLFDQTPSVVVNTSDDSVTLPPGGGIGPIDASQIVLHPGSHVDGPENAILRFIAPVAETYSVTGDFESLHFGSTRNIVLHNGTELFSSLADDSSFNLTVELAAEDTIDFVVNRDGLYFGDSTGLRASLIIGAATVPEPSSHVIYGVGILVAGRLGHRRRL